MVKPRSDNCGENEGEAAFMKKAISAISFIAPLCASIVYLFFLKNAIDRLTPILLLILITAISWVNTIEHYKYNNAHPSDKIKIELKYYPLWVSICLTLLTVLIFLSHNR